MITLEKLLTELKPESLNEIIAGNGCHGGGKPKKNKTKKPKKGKKGGHSGHSGTSGTSGCGCTPPPCCTPGCI